jgi:hypothetical protein
MAKRVGRAVTVWNWKTGTHPMDIDGFPTMSVAFDERSFRPFRLRT